MIDLTDDRPLPEIANDFHGLTTIRKIDDSRGASHYEMYEGFTELIDIRRIQTDGNVRLTLKHP